MTRLFSRRPLFRSTMSFVFVVIVRLHFLFLDTNRTRLVRKAHPAESFFNFFTPPSPPNEGEDENDDEEDQVRPVVYTYCGAPLTVFLVPCLCIASMMVSYPAPSTPHHLTSTSSQIPKNLRADSLKSLSRVLRSTARSARI